MDYKRLFLNWLKQNDPQNKFENNLQRCNKTLKNHIKYSYRYDELIMFNAFSWKNTIEGYKYWIQFYNNWLEFHNEWIRNHKKSTSNEL